MTARGFVAALLAAGTLVLGGPAPVTPPAQAAPALSVTSVVDASYPQQVPAASSGTTVPVRFTVSSSESTAGVTATAVYDGLAVDAPSQSLGTVTAPTTLTFQVAGTEPGLHELTVIVSAPGATSASATLRYIWTTGSPAFAGTNKLYARVYGWEGTEQVAGLESSTRAVTMLTIVDATYAYVGLPPKGRPSCTPVVAGCVPYTFDYRTGLLQVGTGIIGRPHRSPPGQDGLYTDGLVPPDEQDGELYGRYDFTYQLSWARPTTHVTGTFAYFSPDYPTGIDHERVTLRADHTYRLAFSVGGGRLTRLSGRYRVTGHGRVVFRSRTGRIVQVGSLALAPRHLGVWLVLSGPRGRHPDGNLLTPVRR